VFSCFTQGEGWALVDGLVGGELVANVRREIKQLEAQYEAGEIWVGKQADVGAHISVSSVRGDKVLWVDKFGLHDGPFAALRELVRADLLPCVQAQRVESSAGTYSTVCKCTGGGAGHPGA